MYENTNEDILDIDKRFLPEKFSDFGKLLSILENYAESSLSGEDEKVCSPICAEEILRKYNFDIPKVGQSMEGLRKDVDLVLKESPKTFHPYFQNQLYTAPSLPSIIGELTSLVTNTSMATYEIAPFATMVERKLVEFFREKVGYKSVPLSLDSGIMLTGGSNANLVALLVARNTLFPKSKEEGPSVKASIFCSKEAHYSFKKAANVVGIGTKHIYLIDVCLKGKMVPSDLENKIKLSRSKGEVPFFVGATAGTTVRGAFDPLVEIGTIAKKEGLWFHVDGAFGGSILLSEKYKHLLEGSNLSDSFTWDAHKGLSVPLMASFILFKKTGQLLDSNSGGGSEYLFHETESEEYNLGPFSLQCGRRVDALKVWFHLRFYGVSLISKSIEHLFNLANHFEKKVLKEDNFILVYSRESFTVCFRLTSSEVDLDDGSLTFLVRKELLKSKECMINFSTDENGVFLRSVFINPRLTYQNVDKIIIMIKKSFKRVLDEKNSYH